MAKNNLVVSFTDPSHARAAFDSFRRRFPSTLCVAQDLSRVEGCKVILQSTALSIPYAKAKEYLMDSDGAIPSF